MEFCIKEFLLQNYYSVYGGQQFSPYLTTAGASGAAGMLHNFYPLYAQYAQNSQSHGFGVQFPQMVHYPLLPHHYGSAGILSLPSSMAMATTVTTGMYEHLGYPKHLSFHLGNKNDAYKILMTRYIHIEV